MRHWSRSSGGRLIRETLLFSLLSGMDEHRLPNPDDPVDQEDRASEHGDPNHPRTLGDYMNPTRTKSPFYIVFSTNAASFNFKLDVFQFFTVLN